MTNGDDPEDVGGINAAATALQNAARALEDAVRDLGKSSDQFEVTSQMESPPF